MQVSARPANLGQFVTECGKLSNQLKGRIMARRASFDAFIQAENEYPIQNPYDLMGEVDSTTTGAIGQLLGSWGMDETYVQLVKVAFDNADVNGDGLATAESADIDEAFNRAAAAAGLTQEQIQALLTDRSALTVNDPQMAPVPQTSGFVKDPVATASGYFVEIEDDLVMPARLQVLGWRRTYSSGPRRPGPHGRGWGTWASARLELADDQAVYHGPDGQVATFSPQRGGGWARSEWVPGELVTLPGGQGYELRFDHASDRRGQRLRFESDGRLAAVSGPGLGVTTMVHDDGRLVNLVHEGGRSVTVDWHDDRIVGLRSSCGRSVRYHYNDAGDLVQVERAVGEQRYVPDEAGRIVEVFDADGVRLCHNTFDSIGRVLRQVSPFGGETEFDYEPLRRTTVHQGEGNPRSTWEHDAAGRLVGLTNDEGRRMSMSFGSRGQVAALTGYDGRTRTNRFDEAGRVTSTRYSSGGHERFERDEQGRVRRYERADGSWMAFEYADDSSVPIRSWGPDAWELRMDVVDDLVRGVTDADGVTYRFTHDADGNVIEIVDALGNTTRADRDATGQVTAYYLPDGSVHRLEYDDAGRMTALLPPIGGAWRIEWTAAGRPHRVVDPAGGAVTVDYGDHGGQARLTDALGQSFDIRYDQFERFVGFTTPDGRKWEFAHTALGLVDAVHDPAGGSLHFDYDAAGQLAAFTNPNDETTEYKYDRAGRLVELVDPTGSSTRYLRDAVGRVATVIDPEGAATEYDYDSWGRPLKLSHPDGGFVEYRYTPAGRMASVRTAEGRGETYEYDAVGRLVTSTDATGAATTYEYDGCGRMAAVLYPSGRSRRVVSDALGRVVELHQAGFVWRATYDHANRVTTRTDPLGATTSYRYDAAGNLVAVTDPLGNTTRLEWDERGVCVRVVDPFGASVTSEYDELRRMIAFTDQLGRRTSLRRDRAGRVVARSAPTGEVVEYRLNGRGQVTDTRIDGREVLVREYDRCGRPMMLHEPTRNRTHVLTWSAGSRLTGVDTDGRSLRWVLDRDGLVVERDADGRRDRYEYDAAGRVVGQEGDGYGALHLRRDLDGRLVSVLGAGFERHITLDDSGLPVRRVERVGGQLAVTSLTRDEAGRIVSVRGPAGTDQYRYDAAGQLVGAHGPSGSWTFQYDAAGRLVHEEGPRGTRTFLYDDAHELVRIDSDAGTATFAYDALGRRVGSRDEQGRERRYGWDALDRMTETTVDGRTRTLDVDAFGSLVRVDDTELRWDHTTPVPELLSVGDRALVSFGAPPVGEVVGGTVRWFGSDWRDSPAPTDPWGDALDGTDPAGPASGIGFAGELSLDGLSWLRFRAYDPATRQFLSQDPIQGRLGEATGTNPYHYAGNDPIGRTDPLGLNADVTLEQYQSAKDSATGFQWENALAVAAMVTATVFLGPVGMAVVGGLAAFGPEFINQTQAGLGYDYARLATVTAFGAAGGYFGGWLGTVAKPFTNTAGRVVLVETAGNTVPAVAQEAYDATGAPGGDGTWNWENILIAGGTGASGGAAKVAVKGVPDTTPAPTRDPSGNPPDPGGAPPPGPRPPTPGNNNPVPEPPAAGGRNPFTVPDRAGALDARVQDLQSGGNTDVTMGSRQVDANGNAVGNTRPHLQYTDSNGVRHVEFFTEPGASASSLDSRVAAAQAQDPNAVVEVHTVPAGQPAPTGGGG